MAVPNYVIGLLGCVKYRSFFGFAVGKEIEVAWELTNLGATVYPGGTLSVIMSAANGQYVIFNYNIPPLTPQETTTIDRNSQGSPLVTNVLSQGFTLFTAQINNATIESPPGQILNPGVSFLSFLGLSMEEIFGKWALILAIIGLLGTFVTSVIDLLFKFGILH